MSNLIRSRKEYGRPMVVTVAMMLILLFVAVVLLSALGSMSPTTIRQASTIVFLVAWLASGVVYAMRDKLVRKERQAPRRQIKRHPTGQLAATRQRPVATRS